MLNYVGLRLGMLSCYQVKPNVKLQDLILAMPPGDPWDDAALGEALAYVRKSCLLEIPVEFRDMMSQL